MNGHGITLPRILTRTRRRKPRPPIWRWLAAWCGLWLLLLAANLMAANVLSAVGCALNFGCYWRELHRAPADPDAPPLTIREREGIFATTIVALGFITAGLFA